MIRRFDREKCENDKYLIFRMISAMTVLQSGDNHIERKNWPYITLVEQLRHISETAVWDSEELFKCTVFNTLISNLDEHPRNHAFIAKDNAWNLSPAYDLTPSTSISVERRGLALECGTYGRFVNRYNLLSEASRLLLTEDKATIIINTMHDIIKKCWYIEAMAGGVSEIDCEKIKCAFVYDGLDYEI